MRNYHKYELEHRKFSSNAIVGVYMTHNEQGKQIEKRDIVVCPTLKKEDGDIHAEFLLKCLNGCDTMQIIHDLSKKGFLCELVTDGWANWEFDKNNRPDYDTAKPLYEKVDRFYDIHRVSWRGCFYYFDKKRKRLIRDDIGLYSTPMQAVQGLIVCYHETIEDIDSEAFNNPYR